MRGRRSFTLPPVERTPPLWFGVSLAINAAFVAALIVFRIRALAAPEPDHTLAYLLDIPAAPRPEVVQPRRGRPPEERPLPILVPRPSIIPLDSQGAANGGGLGAGGIIGGRDTVIGSRGAGYGRISRTPLASVGPHYGDGILWRETNRAVAAASGDASAPDRPFDMDSIVRLRLLAMADSIQRNPGVDPNAPPNWTFTHDGKKYGLDAQGLHLGSFTIPAPLLALLPMPQGNIDLAAQNARLAAMRADIMRAAARAQAEDDFRSSVRQIRQRADRDRRERQARQQAQHPAPRDTVRP